MSTEAREFLQQNMDAVQFAKLDKIGNQKVFEFAAKYIKHCQPDGVFVCNDSDEDRQYVRDQAIARGEEKSIGLEGQTIHYDGYNDQARDKANTKCLLPKDVDLGPNINATDRDDGLKEVHQFLDGIMKGKDIIIRFFCLGPRNSVFSNLCMQLTDSFYVSHSEDILYRGAYQQFVELGDKAEFFQFCHSAGEVAENKTSVNTDKRRVYMDLMANTVYSTNTQYGGNTIGLKKLAMRLAIQKASREGWLTEHMLLMGVEGPGSRITYFTGAFPSACGKTSTAMFCGDTIIGDDIAYIRAIDGEARAVNVEKGIFGIIRDVNAKDDPQIWEVLTTTGEAIFSNILIDENGKPHWLGNECPVPDKGFNHSGEWFAGKKDAKGAEVTLSHKNARYTIPMERLANLDPKSEDPNGVPVSGFIYGGRDSDTTAPVTQSFNWIHGIITQGASLESETTAATLGAEGVRKFCLMSNLDFIVVPLGKYIQDNLDFGAKVDKAPHIFLVNYFLRGKDGGYLNGMEDKKVWAKWMELRIHGDVDAIKTPVGYIPMYEDLAKLFNDYLGKEYTKAAYTEQFTLRIPKLLDKIERIEGIYRKMVPDAPQVLYDELTAQRKRLEAARAQHGDLVNPDIMAQDAATAAENA